MLRDDVSHNSTNASPAAGSRADTSSSARDLLHRLDEVVRGQSIREVADRLQMCGETVRRMLRGEGRPSTEFLQAVCETYNVSAHWLLFGTGPKFADEVEGTRPRTFMRVAAELRARADEIAVMITELELQLARDRGCLPTQLKVVGRLSAEGFEFNLPQRRQRPRSKRPSA